MSSSATSIQGELNDLIQFFKEKSCCDLPLSYAEYVSLSKRIRFLSVRQDSSSNIVTFETDSSSPIHTLETKNELKAFSNAAKEALKIMEEIKKAPLLYSKKRKTVTPSFMCPTISMDQIETSKNDINSINNTSSSSSFNSFRPPYARAKNLLTISPHTSRPWWCSIWSIYDNLYSASKRPKKTAYLSSQQKPNPESKELISQNFTVPSVKSFLLEPTSKTENSFNFANPESSIKTPDFTVNPLFSFPSTSEASKAHVENIVPKVTFSIPEKEHIPDEPLKKLISPFYPNSVSSASSLSSFNPLSTSSPISSTATTFSSISSTAIFDFSNISKSKEKPSLEIKELDDSKNLTDGSAKSTVNNSIKANDDKTVSLSTDFTPIQSIDPLVGSTTSSNDSHAKTQAGIPIVFGKDFSNKNDTPFSSLFPTNSTSSKIPNSFSLFPSSNSSLFPSTLSSSTTNNSPIASATDSFPSQNTQSGNTSSTQSTPFIFSPNSSNSFPTGQSNPFSFSHPTGNQPFSLPISTPAPNNSNTLTNPTTSSTTTPFTQPFIFGTHSTNTSPNFTFMNNNNYNSKPPNNNSTGDDGTFMATSSATSNDQLSPASPSNSSTAVPGRFIIPAHKLKRRR